MLYPMTLVARDDTNGGGWFNAPITTSGISGIIILPFQPVMSIGATVSGTGYLEFSIDPPAVLDSALAYFEEWDGIARINPAVTGFRVVSTSGLVTANVTVKTFYAS